MYVNVAGGLRIDEPAADLAVAVALASSLRERPVRAATVVAGEVALSGRLRAAVRAERRLLEASRLGFERVITGPAARVGRRAPASRTSSSRATSREALRLSLEALTGRTGTTPVRSVDTHGGACYRARSCGAATSFSVHLGGLEVHPSESSVHMTARIIQLAGALLGTLFGFALGLALLRSTGDLIEPANSPAFLTAFVVAMFLFGYLAIPYVTIYPARRAAEKLDRGRRRRVRARASGPSSSDWSWAS